MNILNKILLIIIICIVCYVVYKQFFSNKRHHKTSNDINDVNNKLIKDFEKKITDQNNNKINNNEPINISNSPSDNQIENKQDDAHDAHDIHDKHNKHDKHDKHNKHDKKDKKENSPYKMATIDNISQFSLDINGLIESDNNSDTTNMYKLDSHLMDDTLSEAISLSSDALSNSDLSSSSSL
jgi:cell division protein FtsI/penicillin-binding protein 2